MPGKPKQQGARDRAGRTTNTKNLSAWVVVRRVFKAQVRTTGGRVWREAFEVCWETAATRRVDAIQKWGSIWLGVHTTPTMRSRAWRNNQRAGRVACLRCRVGV